MAQPIHIQRTQLIRTLEPYAAQKEAWPQEGKHILAHFDDDSVIVYQAFNAEIAAYAVANQRFLGCPKYNPTRMTWIKTNFLWMTYRCGWCAKDTNQARVLALKLDRDGFERDILGHAVGAFYYAGTFDTVEEWKRMSRKENCDVRLQWDPDHTPCGGNVNRRAIQLGLRGAVLQRFHAEHIRAIEDITDQLVLPQRHLTHLHSIARMARQIERAQRGIAKMEAREREAAPDAAPERTETACEPAAAAPPATKPVEDEAEESEEAAARTQAQRQADQGLVLVPTERIFYPADPAVRKRVGMWSPDGVPPAGAREEDQAEERAAPTNDDE